MNHCVWLKKTLNLTKTWQPTFYIESKYWAFFQMIDLKITFYFQSLGHQQSKKKNQRQVQQSIKDNSQLCHNVSILIMIMIESLIYVFHWTHSLSVLVLKRAENSQNLKVYSFVSTPFSMFFVWWTLLGLNWVCRSYSWWN